MLDAIKHGLANLFNVSGRDARQAFWFYVLFIYIVIIALGVRKSTPGPNRFGDAPFVA